MNREQYAADIDGIQKAVRQGRLRSARRAYKQALADYPEMGAAVSSDYGEFMLREVGNGQEASRLFRQAIDQAGSASLEISAELRTKIEVSCCRLLSYYFCASYEEFSAWSDRCLILEPGDVIETENQRKVRAQQEDGVPWCDILMQNMLQAYDPFGPEGPHRGDPAIGLAAAQFMLLNRRQLRIARELQQELMRYLHVAATVNLNRHVETQKQSLGQVELGELELIRVGIRPLFQAYVADNSDDEAVRDKSYDGWLFQPDFLTADGEEISKHEPPNRQAVAVDMWTAAKTLEKTAATLPAMTASPQSAPSPAARPSASLGCLPYIAIFFALGALYQGFINYRAGPDTSTKGLLGIVVGLILLGAGLLLIRAGHGQTKS